MLFYIRPHLHAISVTFEIKIQEKGQRIPVLPFRMLVVVGPIYRIILFLSGWLSGIF